MVNVDERHLHQKLNFKRLKILFFSRKIIKNRSSFRTTLNLTPFQGIVCILYAFCPIHSPAYSSGDIADRNWDGLGMKQQSISIVYCLYIDTSDINKSDNICGYKGLEISDHENPVHIVSFILQ